MKNTSHQEVWRQWIEKCCILDLRNGCQCIQESYPRSVAASHSSNTSNTWHICLEVCQMLKGWDQSPVTFIPKLVRQSWAARWCCQAWMPAGWGGQQPPHQEEFRILFIERGYSSDLRRGNNVRRCGVCRKRSVLFAIIIDGWWAFWCPFYHCGAAIVLPLCQFLLLQPQAPSHSPF